MPSPRNVAETVRQLEAERQRHLEAVRVIDDILNRVSQAVEPGDLPLVPPQPPPKVAPIVPFSPRGRFRQTGEQSILQFVQSHGNPTTSEINEHWRTEGRRGVANVALLKLLKQGLVSRQADPAIRGSRYVFGHSNQTSTMVPIIARAIESPPLQSSIPSKKQK